MRYLFLLVFLSAVISNSICQEKKTKQAFKSMTEFREWVTKRYVVSKEMKKAKLEGTVIASFVVDTTGYMVDFKVVSDLGYGTGEELIRVLQKANEKGVWPPQIRNGKKIPVSFDFPIIISAR